MEETDNGDASDKSESLQGIDDEGGFPVEQKTKSVCCNLPLCFFTVCLLMTTAVFNSLLSVLIFLVRFYQMRV